MESNSNYLFIDSVQVKFENNILFHQGNLKTFDLVCKSNFPIAFPYAILGF